MSDRLPEHVRRDLQRARRLEWWTLIWMSSVVVVMWLVMGSSQAMKTALIEDVLSLVPAIVFLVALHFERKEANRAFPFGFHRVQSLSSLIAAVALCSVGAILVFESLTSLVAQEHPTIPSVRILGHEVWQGWVMIAASVYSVLPPMILGRMKHPIARRLEDEALDTDAMMQKADWMTGLAGITGVVGVALGLWWADAAAAAFISFSILKDGTTSLRIATAELVDGTPRKLGKIELAQDARALQETLVRRYPGSSVRLRATGRFVHAEVHGAASTHPLNLDEIWPGDPTKSWRLAQVSFVSQRR